MTGGAAVCNKAEDVCHGRCEVQEKLTVSGGSNARAWWALGLHVMKMHISTVERVGLSFPPESCLNGKILKSS